MSKAQQNRINLAKRTEIKKEAIETALGVAAFIIQQRHHGSEFVDDIDAPEMVELVAGITLCENNNQKAQEMLERAVALKIMG